MPRQSEPSADPRETIALVEPQALGPTARRPGWFRGKAAPWVIAGTLVVVAIAAIVAVRALTPKPVAAIPPAQTITVGAVTKAGMVRRLVVTGSLAAWDELPLGAEQGGLAIVQVAAEEGDHVTKGQLLARLDDSVLRAELAQADAAVAQAEATLAKTQAMAATAANDGRRARELSKNGFMSSQVAEQRETTLATAQADVNVARQALETAKAVREERAAQLAQTEIRAPTDGIVSKRTATLGNVVAVGQQLFRMIRDARVELRAEVPESDLPLLKAGLPVSITVGDAEPRQFTGKIRLMGATVDPQSRIGIVYVALPEDPLLKPGMFVRGIIETGDAAVLQVPEEAIVFKDAKPAVFVVGDDSHTKLRMVETGERLNGAVEILSGVEAGERVALAGAGYLKDNEFVRVEAPLPATAPPLSEAARKTGGAVR